MHRRTFLDLFAAGVAGYAVRWRLMLSSIEATWLSAERKTRLAADFERDPSWNEAGG